MGRARSKSVEPAAAAATVRWWASSRFAAGVIFFAAWVVYLNSLGGEFVFDDTSIIANNPLIRGLGWSNLKQIFGSHYWQTVAGQGGLYRPVVVLSYALNYATGGLDPMGYHLVNVLVHAVNAVLVFWVARELFADGVLAFWSGLLFALHPVRTEAVAYIVGRAENLAALFLLLAWLAYLKQRLVLGALAFLAALLCKESTFTLLAVLPLSDYVRGRGWDRGTVVRYLLFAAAGGLALGARYAVLGGFAPLTIHPAANPAAAAGTLPRLLTATHVMGKYLWLLVYPAALSADYSFNQIPVISSPWTLDFLAPAAALAALLGATAWAARRDRTLFFCGAFFLATIALTANFIRPIGTIMAERLLYLPSLGFTCAVAHGIARARRRQLAAGVGLAVALLYAGRTIARNADWQDHVTLFTSAAAVSPRSAVVQANLANALLYARGDAAGAARHALEAIRIEPGDPSAYMTLGDAFVKLGEVEQAAQAYAEVERLAPGTAGAEEASRKRRQILR